jgi:hypothetical protein
MKKYKTKATQRIVDVKAPRIPSIRELKNTAGKNQIQIKGSINGQNIHWRTEAAIGRISAITK